ncbi:MAG: hypothetical protein ACI4QH_05220 [Candidatus Fimimonas sp.]
MITVRPSQKKDFRYVQDICVETSSHGGESVINRTVVCALCCDYYLDNQSEFCFVAVDENDVPVGYVLCAVDLDNYKEQMTEEYLPLVRKLKSGDYFDYLSEMKLEQRYYKQGYVAHLHVDVSEVYATNASEEFSKSVVQSMLLTAILQKLQGSLVNETLLGGAFVFCKETDEIISLLKELGFNEIDYVSGREVYGIIIGGEEGEENIVDDDNDGEDE